MKSIRALAKCYQLDLAREFLRNSKRVNSYSWVFICLPGEAVQFH
jgi:hypothetical protein